MRISDWSSDVCSSDLHQTWIGKAKVAQGKSIGLALDSHPRYEVADTSYGMRAAALRSLADGRRYIRVTDYVMPFISLVPGSMSDREGSMFISVPIDNLSHMLFWGFWKEDAPHDPEAGQMQIGRASGRERDDENWEHSGV